MAMTKVPEITLGFWIVKIASTTLFWAAFILTRPLGAALGDFLDKPIDHGELAMNRYAASIALLGFILTSLMVFRQRAARAAH